MAKQQSNHKAWFIKFVGSLVYLYVIWQIWSNPPLWLAGSLSASLPAFGLGLIMAAAVMSSVAYAVATFSSSLMTEKEDKDRHMRMSMWVWRTGMWSTFTLFVLTLPGPLSWLVLIGFVLSFLGSAISMM